MSFEAYKVAIVVPISPASCSISIPSVRFAIGGEHITESSASRMSITKKHSFVIPTEKNQDLIDKAKVLNHVPWCEDYEKMISGMR